MIIFAHEKKNQLDYIATKTTAKFTSAKSFNYVASSSCRYESEFV